MSTSIEIATSSRDTPINANTPIAPKRSWIDKSFGFDDDLEFCPISEEELRISHSRSPLITPERSRTPITNNIFSQSVNTPTYYGPSITTPKSNSNILSNNNKNGNGINLNSGPSTAPPNLYSQPQSQNQYYNYNYSPLQNRQQQYQPQNQIISPTRLNFSGMNANTHAASSLSRPMNVIPDSSNGYPSAQNVSVNLNGFSRHTPNGSGSGTGPSQYY